ncbi:MAG: type I-C CRISPR-associated protein Cas8c/Csd1 [Lachnospiraceae bacterium]|nr:type I-C CRISPR-associated protein Cas8c/Csd1 [Lachnospiraceae bacterium]
MVIESLINYYETLKKEDKVPLPGFSIQKINFKLCLSKNGKLKNIEPLFETVLSPKGKELTFPLKIELPFSGSRSNKVKPYFGWEKESYILGLADPAEKARALKCFNAFRQLQHEVLRGNEKEPVIGAYLTFLDNWDPLNIESLPYSKDIKGDKLEGNYVVEVDGEYLHENKIVKECWSRYYEETEAEGLPEGISIVSGKMGPIAKTHPMITSFPGALSSGAALVSFNLPSVSGEYKDKGENAPMTPYEAFAYTTALKYMLNNKGVFILGDDVIFVWSETDSDEQQRVIRKLVDAVIYGDRSDEEGFNPREMIRSIADGERVVYKGTVIDPNSEYCLLGIEANQARLSIKLFTHMTVGKFMANVVRFYDDIDIAPLGKDEDSKIPTLYLLIGATKRMQDKSSVNPDILEEMIKSVFTGTPFSFNMLGAYNRRFKSTQDIRTIHVSFIKGYYTRKQIKGYPKEVLQVALNNECDDQAYILGRLFFLLERTQIEAIRNIQKTIRDKYIYSASVTPAMVFPMLVNHSEYHLKKMKKIDEKRGVAIHLERQMEELINRISTTYPTRMSLEEQSRFQLGYYHQKAYYFTPKEKKEAASSENTETAEN